MALCSLCESLIINSGNIILRTRSSFTGGWGGGGGGGGTRATKVVKRLAQKL